MSGEQGLVGERGTRASKTRNLGTGQTRLMRVTRRLVLAAKRSSFSSSCNSTYVSLRTSLAPASINNAYKLLRYGHSYKYADDAKNDSSS